MKEIKFKKAQPGDFEFTYQVKKASFKKCVEEIFGWDEEKQRSLHESRFKSQDFEILEYKGEPIGYISTVMDEDSLKINQLFILPDYQGKGIGGECMRKVMDRVSGDKEKICLRVLKNNHHAQDFFKHLGFMQYDESNTHVMMEKHYKKIEE